jgi:hypothetical protein
MRWLPVVSIVLVSVTSYIDRNTSALVGNPGWALSRARP